MPTTKRHILSFKQKLFLLIGAGQNEVAEMTQKKEHEYWNQNTKKKEIPQKVLCI